MKITIDTKEDSHEEIRKVIDILTGIAGVNGYSQQPQDSEPLSGSIFHMFSNNREEGAPATGEMPTSEQVAGMFSENREEAVDLPEPKVVDGVKRETGEDDPQVVPY